MDCVLWFTLQNTVIPQFMSLIRSSKTARKVNS
jgi:hypothetical protein